MRRVLRVALLIGMFALVALPAEAQLSPGALSKAHSKLDGMVSCGNCHTFGAGTPQLKCMSCHVEIQKRVSEKRGYHGQIVNSAIGDNDCSRCHSEHGGREFALIHWPEPQSKFDHRKQTGFALEGKHAALMCAQCHTSRNIAAVRRTEIALKDLDRSFLGLGTDCASCHQDAHRGQLGANCATCHSQSSWKPAPGFNHANTRYPLTGMHQSVSCERCHSASSAAGASNGVVERVFRDVKSGDCVDCHKDPHLGSFAGGCKQCHATSSWKTISFADSKFDHSRTKYPLTGLHVKVACLACHKGTNFSSPIRSAQCMDCHSDKHKGQFLARVDKGECATCHTVNGFKPTSYTVQMHASTPYPLAGKHVSVACAACHQPKGEATDYHPKSGDCLTCHHDAHKGQFAGAPYANRCESCHVVDGFKPSTFTAELHSATRYPLAGKHVSVTCEKCHENKGEATDFHPKSGDCLACHRDAHQDQFAAAPYANKCESCHTLDGFHPSTFTVTRHRDSKFQLTGGHAATACVECHKPRVEANALGMAKLPGMDSHQFRFSDTSCVTCHNDPHGTLTDSHLSCESCHTLRGWSPTLAFDHSKTTFPLEGSHRTMDCQQCHKAAFAADGLRRMSFRDAPGNCAGCHEDVHGGQFPKAKEDNCASCHGTTRWKPSSFDHESARFSLAGAHRAVSCEACHKSRKEVDGRAVLVYGETKRECAACH
jgi:hypothetical protein